ncbi:uncharacterized protein G2W53_026599 [Senna tora]|uniref:Uncharacterized protein n=1 Tax=Senna tora TaxID=362788 RepID=A0A834TPC9_9FABA|nr:uncharacterized protein G2W53_026599 [Senna tora]
MAQKYILTRSQDQREKARGSTG